MREPKSRNLVLAMGLLWFSVSFSYYGLNQSAAALVPAGFNVYLVSGGMALVELPANVVAFYGAEIAGRVLAHSASRGWLDLETIRAMCSCPILSLAIPGCALVDLSWAQTLSTHSECMRLDLSGAVRVVKAEVVDLGAERRRLHRRVAVGGRAIAELADVVVSEAPHRAVSLAHQRVHVH